MSAPSLERPESVTLAIEGMTCAACQHHVEAALREVPGVATAEVNLLANRATVTFTPRVGRVEALLEAVRQAGYEPGLPSVAAQKEPADERLTLRAGLAIATACLVMGLSMSHWGMSSPAARWFELWVTLAVMGVASPQTYRRAWKAMRRGSTNMNTLVALGTLSAFCYSAAATIAPSLFHRLGLAADVYYEAVLFIIAFLLVGSALDARARRRTTEALRGFSAMQPTTALVERNGAEREVALAEVASGETVVVRPGDRVPVDGVVLAGSSSVDQALLTGESAPVARGVGDAVIGGTVNLDGVLRIRATTVGAAGMLAQMQRLLDEAQASRAPMQAMADRASSVFVPVVLALAAATFVVWLIVGGGAAALPRAIAAAVAVLVIACPCAMGLAVPAAVTVAIGRGAQRGALIKGGDVLERLARIDTIALDKTGTLTAGTPRVVDVFLADERADRRRLLEVAVGLERRANHPLARAVVAYGTNLGLGEVEIEAIRTVPGMGVTGLAAGSAVALGNAAMLARAGVAVEEASSGGTLLYLAIDRRHVLTIVVEDEVRISAQAALAELKALRIAVTMLTGDRMETAMKVAARLGIAQDHVEAGMFPETKLRWVKAMQSRGHSVAMAGDGMNDAAALAQADAGFAIGSGTDLARDAGDVVLLSPSGELSLMAIPDTIRLARRAVRTMRQNLWWATIYNAIGLPLAAGVFYPHFHLLLSPVVASAAMALSSTSVLVNSLRLRRFR